MYLTTFMFFFVYVSGLFWTENESGRAREVFKKLPGGCSFVLTEYDPMASHGDPKILSSKIYLASYAFFCFVVVFLLQNSRNLKFRIFKNDVFAT